MLPDARVASVVAEAASALPSHTAVIPVDPEITPLEVIPAHDVVAPAAKPGADHVILEAVVFDGPAAHHVVHVHRHHHVRRVPPSREWLSVAHPREEVASQYVAAVGVRGAVLATRIEAASVSGLKRTFAKHVPIENVVKAGGRHRVAATDDASVRCAEDGVAHVTVGDTAPLDRGLIGALVRCVVFDGVLRDQQVAWGEGDRVTTACVHPLAPHAADSAARQRRVAPPRHHDSVGSMQGDRAVVDHERSRVVSEHAITPTMEHVQPTKRDGRRV
mmetsp:Transcript_93028/g.279063  ORF Transcript_93028/g.279063 Transcript_93028/m.279063 type:complete len:275 (-) Transcript_93028:228-1052(-)